MELADTLVREKLDFFLKLHPQIEVPRGSKSTTPPSKFSQHLDDSLILKRVAYDSELISRLRNAVDEKITQFDKKTTFEISLPLTDDRDRFETKVLDAEAKCVEYQDKTLARLHGPIATALLNGRFKALSGEKNSMFLWTARDMATDRGNIPDGILKVDDSYSSSLAVQSSRLKHLQEIAAWEFKRPQVIDEGLRKTMQEIIEEGAFRWCRCTIVNADNAVHQDKCKAKQHLTPDGAYIFHIKPRGPDVFSPSVSGEESGGAHLRPNLSATVADKAHNIFQQVWANGVMGDFTYIVLSSVEWELICLRHRESQTLFVSDMIETSETKDHTKIAVGLYLAAWEDALKRDKLIDDALIAQAKRFAGCTQEERKMFETIVRHWKVPSSKSPSYEHTIEKDEIEAEEKLSLCDSIYLVAPIPQYEGKCKIFSPELPHLWTRVNDKIETLFLKQADDEESDSEEDDAEGGMSTIEEETETEEQDEQTHVAEAGPRSDGPEEDDSPDVHKTMCAVVMEESPPYADHFLHDYEIPSSQPSAYIGEPPNQVSTPEENPLFDPATNWAMPPAEAIEIYATKPISRDVFGAKVRFKNRYLLRDQVEVKIYKIDVRNEQEMINQINKVQLEYNRMELTQERTKFDDYPFSVYGVFSYNHAIKDETKPRQYKLALQCAESREKVPIRYLAILTTPTGRGLKTIHSLLTKEQIADFAKILIQRHKAGYLHGNIRGENLRILANGRACILGWEEPSKHDLTNEHFKKRADGELSKLEVFLKDRQSTIKDHMNSNSADSSSQSAAANKRKAKARISLDRKHKKPVLGQEVPAAVDDVEGQ